MAKDCDGGDDDDDDEMMKRRRCRVYVGSELKEGAEMSGWPSSRDRLT